MKIKTLLLLTGLLSFTACDERVKLREFNEIYTKICSEAASVPIEEIRKSATCNGQPLLLALLQSDHYKIERDLPDIYSYLVKRRGFESNFKVGEKSSFLMEAIEAKRFSVALRVLNKAPLITDNYEYTALHALIENASSHDKKNTSTFVKYYSGDLEKETTWGQTPLQLAYENNLPNIVWSLLSRDVDNSYILEKIINNEIKPEFYFHPEIAKASELLREASSALDRRFTYDGKTDYTLMHYAAESGNTTLIKLLLNQGMDSTIVSSIGTPIEIAAEHGHEEIIKIFLENYTFYENTSAINKAISKGHFNIANLLLNAGLNILDYSHLISFNKEYSKLDYYKRFLRNGGPLIKYHIRESLETVHQSHAITSFEEKTRNNIMHIILGFNMDKEASVVSGNLKFLKKEFQKVFKNWEHIALERQLNTLGQSPLTFALHEKGRDNLKMIDISKVTMSKVWKGHWGLRDKLGFVPVHYAFMLKGSIPTVKELKVYIKNGAEINFVNPLGETILHMSARYGAYDISKYLLKKPLFSSRPDFNIENSINLRNIHGESVLTLAKKSGNKKLIKLIKSLGGE